MTSIGLRTAVLTFVKRHFRLALVLTFAMPLQCATLERLSLDDMITKSSSIVRGKVSSSYAAFSGPVVYTHYVIQVSERFKGAAAGDQVEVLVPGGAVKGQRQSFAGTPSLTGESEYVFFLWTSRSGLTQLIGLTQGLFSVSADTSGDPFATRAATRELMLDSSSGQPVKDQTLKMHLSELRSRISRTLATAGAGGGK